MRVCVCVGVFMAFFFFFFFFEASSLYFSLLIGYRVQALTVVKPSEERARSAQRVATGGPPSGGGLGGSREAPTASPPTQP